ncbi:MAG TPA: Ig-like domain repeat protein [Trebonia sp.]|nr:Ig-like domain repeat protein [Trebonia sp.]
MTTIRRRPYAGDGTAVIGRAGTMPALGSVRPGTAITLTSGATTSTAGGMVAYTATVRPAPGGGTVAFADGTTPVPGCGARPVGNAGTATCQVAYSGAGTHAITAAYYTVSFAADSDPTTHTVQFAVP